MLAGKHMAGERANARPLSYLTRIGEFGIE
jgi:hypothetical protein